MVIGINEMGWIDYLMKSDDCLVNNQKRKKMSVMFICIMHMKQYSKSSGSDQSKKGNLYRSKPL